MASRHEDWLKQGRRNVEHAHRAMEDGDYDWACFASQQGGEKAIKAVFLKAGGIAWSHSVTPLLESLPESMAPGTGLIDAAKELDRHYIPARYPNAHPQGAPYEYYTRGEAERAIGYAKRIIEFCAGILAESSGDPGPTEKRREGPDKPPSRN
jgi:HEPN domain-containing protein